VTNAVGEVKRETLANASQLVVECVPQADRLVVVLTLSTEGQEDTPATYGWRHLLEHLVARGPDGNLDTRIESQGMLLVPSTLRDASRFDVRGGPEQLNSALGFLGELTGPLQATDAQRETELRIMTEEFALISESSAAGTRAWRRVYGPTRMDPFGHPDTLARATLDDLDRLRRGLFVSNRMTLNIAGPGTVESMVEAGRDWLTKAPSPGFAAPTATAEAGALPTIASGLATSAALPVGAWDDPKAAARLGAALALADRAPDIDLIYTPARREGLIILVVPADGDLAGVLNVPDDELAYRAQQAQRRLSAWLGFQMGTLERRTQFRGLLASLSRRGRPERLVEIFQNLKTADFLAALRDWRRAEVGQ